MNLNVFFRLIWLNCRRLLRRKLFLAMLLSLFLSAFALGHIARSTEGVVTAAVYVPSQDALSKEVIEKLRNEQGLFHILEYESEAEARAAVDSGGADAAWIFPEDLPGKAAGFVRSEIGRKPVIEIYEREDTTALRLSRERLFSLIYPELSYDLFEHFVSLRIKEAGGEVPAEAEMKDFYHAGVTSGSIIEHRTLDELKEKTGADNETVSNYLLTPVRGMAALIILLSMLAAAMYCREDREAGRMAAFPGRGRGPLILAYLLPAGMLSSLAALLAFGAAGIAGSWTGELLSMLCLLLLSVGFCALLYLVIPTSGGLAAVLPFVILLVLLQCPVFLDIPSLQPLRVLLPPYYYIEMCGSMFL